MTQTMELDPPIVLNAGEWAYFATDGERVRWAVYDGEDHPDSLLRQGESRVVGNTCAWPHTLPVAWPENDETPDP